MSAGVELPATGPDGQARRDALATLADWDPQPTSMVSYASAGRLLIVGDRSWTERALETLGHRLECTVATPAGPSGDAAAGGAGGAVEWIPSRITRGGGAPGGVLRVGRGGGRRAAPCPLAADP